MRKLSKLNPLTTIKQVGKYIIPGVIIVTFLALLLYIYEANRPVALADIKVPVATDKASYYPGQKISGIFFGETYYEGNFRILREVFCSNYKGLITPPTGVSDGDFYQSQSKRRTLEGATVLIGELPKDIPIGSNCVLQFTNIYHIDTLFGEREEPYVYYTQNFAIVTKERRDLLDCEATGRKDCEQVAQTDATHSTYVFQSPEQNNNTGTASTAQPPQVTQPSQSQSQTQTMPETATNPPYQIPKPCTLDVLGLCIVR